MARTGLPFVIGGYDQPPLARKWHERYRPIPPGFTFLDEDTWRRDLAQGRFDVVIAHNEMNAATLSKEALLSGTPLLLVCHNRRSFLETTMRNGPGSRRDTFHRLLETLGGVGSGTIIENIEIVSNDDDGIEWFGGTVNVKNVVVWNTGDDAIDTDQSWGGTLDNFIIINPGDECLELDGPEGTMVAKHTIKNGTVYAGNAQGIADLDDANNASDSYVDIDKVYFFGLKAGQDFDSVPTYYNCTFSNMEATIPAGTTLTDFFKDGSSAFTISVNAGANTVGADASAFTGWSWTAVSGSLNGF
ncbi:MAG TPA: hypothetical protein PLA65_19240 [Spirochaetota bacterium]|nr:hypothetical protein [Spirochaetota bacterium]